MAHGQGNRPRIIEVVMGVFHDGRDSLAGFLAIQSPTQEQKDRMLALYDGWLAFGDEGAHCDAISQAWGRCIDSAAKTRRIRDLESQYIETHGALPIDAAALDAA